MSIQINLGAWRSVFAVPSQIVDEGLKFADGVKLKVLLYVLRNADRELALEEISKATGVNVTDIPEALDYWVSREVLQKNTAGYAPKANDHQTEQEKPVVKETKTVASISKDVEQQRQRFVVTKPQKPDYVFTAQRLAADEDLKILVSEAQTMLGKTLSNSDVATLLMLKDTCGLRLDVILMLIQYCVGIDKGNMRTVEKIGISWADEGINSVEAADRKIARREWLYTESANPVWKDRPFEVSLQAPQNWTIRFENAITEDGVLVNIDGNANRVSAIAFGPKKVVLIVGMNKVCSDVDAAMKRARGVAAPTNAQRFGLSTPCAKTGSCMNCKSPDTICCQFLVTRFSRHAGRIHVILVNDTLGY